MLHGKLKVSMFLKIGSIHFAAFALFFQTRLANGQKIYYELPTIKKLSAIFYSLALENALLFVDNQNYLNIELNDFPLILRALTHAHFDHHSLPARGLKTYVGFGHRPFNASGHFQQPCTLSKYLILFCQQLKYLEYSSATKPWNAQVYISLFPVPHPNFPKLPNLDHLYQERWYLRRPFPSFTPKLHFFVTLTKNPFHHYNQKDLDEYVNRNWMFYPSFIRSIGLHPLMVNAAHIVIWVAYRKPRLIRWKLVGWEASVIFLEVFTFCTVCRTKSITIPATAPNLQEITNAEFPYEDPQAIRFWQFIQVGNDLQCRKCNQAKVL